MNLQQAIEAATELANENREQVLICTDADAQRSPFYWTVPAREAHWMLSENSAIVRRIKPEAAR